MNRQADSSLSRKVTSNIYVYVWREYVSGFLCAVEQHIITNHCAVLDESSWEYNNAPSLCTPQT